MNLLWIIAFFSAAHQLVIGAPLASQEASRVPKLTSLQLPADGNERSLILDAAKEFAQEIVKTPTATVNSDIAVKRTLRQLPNNSFVIDHDAIDRMTDAELVTKLQQLGVPINPGPALLEGGKAVENDAQAVQTLIADSSPQGGSSSSPSSSSGGFGQASSSSSSIGSSSGSPQSDQAAQSSNAVQSDLSASQPSSVNTVSGNSLPSSSISNAPHQMPARSLEASVDAVLPAATLYETFQQQKSSFSPVSSESTGAGSSNVNSSPTFSSSIGAAPSSTNTAFGDFASLPTFSPNSGTPSGSATGTSSPTFSSNSGASANFAETAGSNPASAATFASTSGALSGLSGSSLSNLASPSTFLSNSGSMGISSSNLASLFDSGAAPSSTNIGFSNFGSLPTFSLNSETSSGSAAGTGSPTFSSNSGASPSLAETAASDPASKPTFASTSGASSGFSGSSLSSFASSPTFSSNNGLSSMGISSSDFASSFDSGASPSLPDTSASNVIAQPNLASTLPASSSISNSLSSNVQSPEPNISSERLFAGVDLNALIQPYGGPAQDMKVDEQVQMLPPTEETHPPISEETVRRYPDENKSNTVESNKEIHTYTVAKHRINMKKLITERDLKLVNVNTNYITNVRHVNHPHKLIEIVKSEQIRHLPEILVKHTRTDKVNEVAPVQEMPTQEVKEQNVELPPIIEKPAVQRIGYDGSPQ